MKHDNSDTRNNSRVGNIEHLHEAESDATAAVDHANSNIATPVAYQRVSQQIGRHQFHTSVPANRKCSTAPEVPAHAPATAAAV